MPGTLERGYDAQVSRAISGALAFSALALAGIVVIALGRVGSLEARELDVAGAPTAAASARLLEAILRDGDHVELELCSGDAMDPRWESAGSIAMLRTDRAETMFEIPIDARFLEGARRGPGESCVTWARVSGIALDAPEVPIAIELRWSAAFSEPVRARVMARRPLGSTDLYLVIAALVVGLSLVVVLAIRAPAAGHDEGRAGLVRAVVGVAAVLSAGVAIGMVGHGATVGLAGGLALAAVEVIAAFLLIRPRDGSRASVLGLERSPRAPRWAARFLAREGDEAGVEATARTLGPPFAIGWLVLAPLAGFGLFLIARVALAAIPSSGEAPVEAFVSWPSGMLSFAALAVIAPIAEEIFFRGLVFGALRGPGGAARTAGAIAGSWLLFALFHLPQDWGSWGGLTSVLAAGLGFTLLRAGTRSTLVPCVAHLVYNGLLASTALLAGAAV